MQRDYLAHCLFGYELASAAFLALVIKGVMTKRQATILVNDCLNHAVEVYPDLQPLLEQIAAKNTAQIEMVMLDYERTKKKRDGEG